MKKAVSYGFERPQKIQVTEQIRHLDGKNTIIENVVTEVDKIPDTPVFDLYTLEDELKAGVEIARIDTRVLTPQRPIIPSALADRLSSFDTSVETTPPPTETTITTIETNND